MLVRAYRLRRTSDLAKVYKYGKSSGGSGFYVKARLTHLPNSRVAIVVTKKVSKKATVRNRFKRQISEIVRTNWSQLKPGFDVIIMVTSDLTDTTQPKLQQDIVRCLQQLGVA